MHKQQRTLQDVLALNDYICTMADATNVLNEASAHLGKCDRRVRTMVLLVVTNAILWAVVAIHDYLRKRF